ncbi:penicillin-binding transpeptidase domain-containing protein [Marinithermus hydrothermalis]|uniref:Penicillin-binding protein 2 n=1 Tax=Marinithermus hydrothermalis (strain DSM 14884 / JCM 11576 / T1) TaxID=869210 RepID=F2NLV9_MARHT|nr:penicillin-binding transpeptidase domain-containing protein [Marinithermus hydrothermalis]AEB11216.1 penicillin-binding protein 2 [Marinithermus hydrothermalis DSM 14884]
MPERVRALLVLIYLVLLGFTGRLFQLQVLQYQEYATQSEGNYLKTVTIPAPRGRLYDRNGVLLADNRIAVDLWYKGGPILFERRILDLLDLETLPEVEGEPVVLKANLPDELVPTLAELTAGQENLELRERIERYYPNPISGPVLGYVQPANAAEVAAGYEPDDLVGRAGLEAALEEVLRGERGFKLVEVDVRGRRIREEVRRPPVPGQDVYLTIDLALQRAAEQALVEAVEDLNAGRRKLGLPLEEEARGAIVAVDPRTGEVLAMATTPAYDPNVFTRRPTDPRAIAALQNDPHLPLLNRAVQRYTPGSTFKLVTSSALLEHGYVRPDTVYRCTPYIVYGGQVRRNWAPRDMGDMTVREAIANSCNTWYYQAAIDAGPRDLVDVIAKRGLELGLGRPTGLEIAESQGLLPTRAWKREAYGEPWYPGETLSVAIGQGQVLVTPAQVARMLATIAMSGQQPELHLVRRVGADPVEPVVTEVEGRYWRVLQEGLRKTVTEGTARFQLGDFPVPTGGKTGTAETPGKRAGYEHAWYMGYGPTDPSAPHPPLVVVAFFENAGEGSRVALPAVRKVMAAYWKVEVE